MPTLTTQLRNKLERTVIDARDAAEAGAKEALEALAVHHHEPYGHMDPDARQLRRHLRARARQLGDKQDKSGRLDMRHIVHECAYEYWHRMLFARFLAENDLLIDPDMGVPITLAECEELARDAGQDKWVYASHCAQDMLPQIFRPDDPLLKIPFAANHRIQLERLLDGLTPDTFTATDAIGWVYQFWQSKKKDEVNASGNKIGADELPAVTQLFTEDYMVDFLLDNTLGAWWAGKHLTTEDAESAKTEEELRRKLALPGCPWAYLRFVQEDGVWKPAAGTYDGWPEKTAELKCLDPCCGSGHFLVAMLERLVPMRMAEEGLSKADAVRAVLHDNIHGLEIDPRCTQLAAFALALAAWKMAAATVKEALPQLNIACCGLEIGGTKEEWCALAPGNNFIMNQVYDLFRNASALGSLIDPSSQVKTTGAGPDIGGLKDAILQGLEAFRQDQDFERQELGVSGGGIMSAHGLLTMRYDLVTTNVPYLGIRRQSDPLRTFCMSQYPDAKEDVATVFCARALEWLRDGALAVVTPQNWYYQHRYRHHRRRFLDSETIQFVAPLGEGGFQSPQAAGAFAALTVVTSTRPAVDSTIAVIDASDPGEPSEKAALLVSGDVTQVNQLSQLDNPDARLTLERPHDGPLLSNFVDTAQGIKTGDDFYWVRAFWEVHPSAKWRFYQTSTEVNIPYGGRSLVINWGTEGRGMVRPRKGSKVVGRKGVVTSAMREINATLYSGDLHYSLATPLVPHDPSLLPAIWCFCTSPGYNRLVREIEKNIAVTTDTFAKVPFDEELWRGVAQERYPNGLPLPQSNDPTQWIFHGHPAACDRPLQNAVAGVLQYRWPAQLDGGMELADCQRKLANRSEALLGIADRDGIVCIPSVRGEDPAADRLLALLRKAYGDDWTDTKVRELIAATGSKAKSLDDWLRNDFFEQHCKLFHHRPFIWHIWDGRKRDGFHALVNYHKLAEGNGEGRKVLEKLTHSYLGEWITRQKDGVARGEGGAEDRLAAAVELQNCLLAILKGEPPFDIFVRWKPLHQQAIGWNPDINDGVRLNIRPFMASDLPGGKKGAGILRWKPNIKWGKDRGKEPQRPKDEYPWFWSWDEATQDFKGGADFDGNRWNDLHYTNAAKEAARGRFTAEDTKDDFQ